jgi:hypothetical protein
MGQPGTAPSRTGVPGATLVGTSALGPAASGTFAAGSVGVTSGATAFVAGALPWKASNVFSSVMWRIKSLEQVPDGPAFQHYGVAE